MSVSTVSPRLSRLRMLAGDEFATTEARKIPFARPLITDAERRAVLQVLRGSTLTHGPMVKRFEADFARFTGAEHAVATSSCAAALHLACLAVGLGPGDEAIVPAQTHVATAHAVELCGAKCVFADCDPNTGNVTAAHIEPLITKATRAILVVHYLGFPVDLPGISALACERGLKLIEDCALAIGATVDGVHVGLWGDAGCFSFYPAKHMTTGEGGMLITRSGELAASVRSWRAFGIDRSDPADRALPGQYDVVGLGLNYRMDEISAALGIEQLRRVRDWLCTRRRNFERLRAGLSDLPGLRVLGEPSIDHAACYCLSVQLTDGDRNERDELLRQLTARGIGASVYYPGPVPCLAYYQNRYGTPDCPVARSISETSIALPVGPHLRPEDVETIIGAMRELAPRSGQRA